MGWRVGDTLCLYLLYHFIFFSIFMLPIQIDECINFLEVLNAKSKRTLPRGWLSGPSGEISSSINHLKLNC